MAERVNADENRPMSQTSKAKKSELNPKELKKLRREIWVVLPFFIFSLYIFVGSFRYKIEARSVPMAIGFITIVLSGMRLFHLIFPRSKIGDFKEAGLSGEFDSIKEEIEEVALKGRYEEEKSKEITFREERKAYIALIGSFFVFILLGYLVGLFFVIVGISYYYDFKKKGPLLITLASMYLIVYGILYKLMGAPAYFGILLTPILKSLRFI